MSTPYNPSPEGELVPPVPVPPVEPQAPVPRENPPWRFWDVVFLACITLAAIAILQFIAVETASQYLPGKSLLDMAKMPKIVIPAQFLAYALVLGCMVLLLRSKGLHFWRNVPWRWPVNPVVLFLGGIGLSVGIQLCSLLLPIPKQLPIDQYFSDTLGVYMLAIFGVTVAPLMEELFFRGFLYPVLVRGVGYVPSIVITSLLFAMIHASQLGRAWAPLLLLFAVGVALTLTRAKTGSVAASFLVHVGYNFSLFSVMWFATDHFRHLDKMT